MSESGAIVVRGEVLANLPQDLFIPPDALEVVLEAFEGPLDLLLYLVRRDRLDIMDIPIAKITEQYLSYIDLMKDTRLELAAEYLVMAAMLAEIKSRMLLPRPVDDVGEEEDPRAQLARRLREYERYRAAAESMDKLERLDRDVRIAEVVPPARPPRPDAAVSLEELLRAFSLVLARIGASAHHRVRPDALSVRERMTDIMARLGREQFVPFDGFFQAHEGRLGVVVTFLAMLELIKEGHIVAVQTEAFAPIHVRAQHG